MDVVHVDAGVVIDVIRDLPGSVGFPARWSLQEYGVVVLHLADTRYLGIHTEERGDRQLGIHTEERGDRQLGIHTEEIVT